MARYENAQINNNRVWGLFRKITGNNKMLSAILEGEKLNRVLKQFFSLLIVSVLIMVEMNMKHRVNLYTFFYTYFLSF